MNPTLFRLFFSGLFACISLLYSNIVFAENSRMVLDRSGSYLEDASGRPLFGMKAKFDSSCAGQALFTQESAKLNTNSLLLLYFSSGHLGDVAAHLETLQSDGMRQDVGVEMRTSSDLKEAFRNLKSATCLYTISGPNWKLYRVLRAANIPGVKKTLELKSTFMEQCDSKSKCKLTTKFYNLEALEALMAQIDQVSSVTQVGQYEKIKKVARGNFMLARKDRGYDVEIDLASEDLELSVGRYPRVLSYSPVHVAESSLYFGNPTLPPVLKTQSPAGTSSNKPIAVLRLLSLNLGSLQKNGVRLALVQTDSKAVDWLTVSLHCENTVCGFGPYLQGGVGGFMLGIQLTRID